MIHTFSDGSTVDTNNVSPDEITLMEKALEFNTLAIKLNLGFILVIDVKGIYYAKNTDSTSYRNLYMTLQRLVERHSGGRIALVDTLTSQKIPTTICPSCGDTNYD